MLKMLLDIDGTEFHHRSYVINKGDGVSASMAMAFEGTLRDKAMQKVDNAGLGTDETAVTLAYGQFDVVEVPRARAIYQPFYTAPWSCLKTFTAALGILPAPSSQRSHTSLAYPNLIVCNGPANSVMFLLAAIFLKFLGMVNKDRMRAIYVESWARLDTLSLSGKLVYYLGLAERFIVQWKNLEEFGDLQECLITGRRFFVLPYVNKGLTPNLHSWFTIKDGTLGLSCSWLIGLLLEIRISYVEGEGGKPVNR
jgi:beta-1,4-N-acetylglucosaminyltransferase